MTADRMGRQLARVLDEERQALMAGDLGRLGPLVRRKERLVQDLAATPPGDDMLARLARMSARNKGLLDAAQAGLVAVRDRMAEIGRGAPVGTYSRHGEKSEIASPLHTLHRRA